MIARPLHCLIAGLCLLIMTVPIHAADSAWDAASAEYRQAVEQAAASVVQIRATLPPAKKTKPSTADPLGMPMDPAYLERPDAPFSGVILDDEGHILTSNLNIANGQAENLVVILADGSELPATVLGRHEDWDVALVKVEALPALHPIARLPDDATMPAVGSAVLALGKSRDAAVATATAGIVSAWDRRRGTALQVSCRLNWGNAGGPVIDLQSRLVGLATRVRPSGLVGMNSGVGFIVPWQRLLEILPELKQGKVWEKTASDETPFLGVGPALSQPKDCPGAQIAEVLPGSAAETAGLKPGDIITHIDGTEVKNFHDVRNAIQMKSIGDTLEVTWLREGQEMSGSATLTPRLEE